MPSINRAVVPELPQLRRELGVRSRELEILTPDSEILEIVAPSWRNTRALLFTSAPVSSPDSSLVPRASAASMSTRWEMLLSPGGRTTPPTRRTLLVANPPAPARRPGEPRRECGGIAHLERALHGAQRFLQGAQRRQDLVAIHEQDFRPQRRVAGREARGGRGNRRAATPRSAGRDSSQRAARRAAPPRVRRVPLPARRARSARLPGPHRRPRCTASRTRSRRETGRCGPPRSRADGYPPADDCRRIAAPGRAARHARRCRASPIRRR